MLIFFTKNAEISKIKEILVLKGSMYSETTYLRTKFQVSSLILTSLGQRVILPFPLPYLKTNP